MGEGDTAHRDWHDSAVSLTIVIVLEYFGRDEAETRSIERFRALFPEQVDAIRRAVAEGYAFDPETVAGVISPDLVDEVIENALTVRLRDNQLAKEVYDDLSRQVLGTDVRWNDLRVHADMKPWPNAQQAGRGSMFVMTIRWEYSTTLLRDALTFWCCKSLESYAKRIRQILSVDQCWYMEHLVGLEIDPLEAFRFSECDRKWTSLGCNCGRPRRRR